MAAPSPPRSPTPVTDGLSHSSIPASRTFDADLMTAALDESEPQEANAIPQHVSQPAPLLDLPLPLTHPSRIYPSPLPHVRLTHPNGWLEGSVPVSDAITAFGSEFIAENRVKSAEQLTRKLDTEVQRAVEELKEKLRERERSDEKNKEIEEQIESRKAEREIERKVMSKFRGKGMG